MASVVVFMTFVATVAVICEILTEIQRAWNWKPGIILHENWLEIQAPLAEQSVWSVIIWLDHHISIVK